MKYAPFVLAPAALFFILYSQLPDHLNGCLVIASLFGLAMIQLLRSAEQDSYGHCPQSIGERFIVDGGNGSPHSVRCFAVGELEFTTLADALANQKRGQTIFIITSMGNIFPCLNCYKA